MVYIKLTALKNEYVKICKRRGFTMGLISKLIDIKNQEEVEEDDKALQVQVTTLTDNS